MTKHKVQFEYTMHCLSEILYEYMATAEGLSEWFADEAVERGDDFYFSWNGGRHQSLISWILGFSCSWRFNNFCDFLKMVCSLVDPINFQNDKYRTPSDFWS